MKKGKALTHLRENIGEYLYDFLLDNFFKICRWLRKYDKSDYITIEISGKTQITEWVDKILITWEQK